MTHPDSASGNPNVGFVGLGRMGRSMALNLAAQDFSLTVFDVRDEAMQGFDESNRCRRASSANDAADGQDIVITVLPGPAELDSVVLADGGMLDNLAPGSILMDLSTVLPETTDALASAASDRGLHFVDAPIGRLAEHADRGESLFMIGAEDEIYARVKPLLEAMGSTLHHCGGPGTGTRTKLINNFLAIVSCQMNAECLALSQHFGLDLSKTLEVIHGTSATNGQLKLNYENKVLKGDIDPGFAIELAHKDLSLIINSAHAAKVPVPIVSSARDSLNLARSADWGHRDFSAMCDFWCETASVPKARLDE